MFRTRIRWHASLLNTSNKVIMNPCWVNRNSKKKPKSPRNTFVKPAAIHEDMSLFRKNKEFLYAYPLFTKCCYFSRDAHNEILCNILYRFNPTIRWHLFGILSPMINILTINNMTCDFQEKVICQGRIIFDDNNSNCILSISS